MTRFVIGYSLLLIAAWCVFRLDGLFATSHREPLLIACYIYIALSTGLSGASMVRPNLVVHSIAR